MTQQVVKVKGKFRVFKKGKKIRRYKSNFTRRKRKNIKRRRVKTKRVSQSRDQHGEFTRT